MTTLETIYKAFQQNPNRLTYSTTKLQQQFNATSTEIKQAKVLYKLNPLDFIVAQALYLTESQFEDAVWAGEYTPVKSDSDQWEVKQKWVKGKEGSKLLVRKEQEIDYKKEFTESVNSYSPKTQKVISRKESRNDNLAVVCMFDLHLGKIAHQLYTGNVDSLYMQGDYYVEFENLKSFLSQQNIEQIYLPIGNDLFNVDDTRLTTTKGTPQDNTKDLHGMFQLGLDLMTYSIDSLIKIAPVKVILVPGNHATNSETYLALALDAIYKNNPDVTVDHSPMGRKYYTYGQNLIGFSHGELPLKKYAELLPYEAKAQFASAKHIEVLVGDKHIEELHKSHIADGDGLTVRRLAALTKTDLWHYQQGYTLSKRRCYVLIYNAQDGLTIQYTNNSN